MAGQYALGRLFNIGTCVVPVDLSGGAQTGVRVHLKDYEGVAFVYYADAGTAGEDVDLDVQQHNVATSGTPADLDVVTVWYSKRETTLDNDETWTKSTQTAASEVDLGDDEGEVQVLAVVEVTADQLSDGYEWVSVNTTDPGTTTGKLGCVLAILYGPKVQRAPENLEAPL
jgi:hypothetical protein